MSAVEAVVLEEERSRLGDRLDEPAVSRRPSFAWEPCVTLADYRLWEETSWEDLDHKASMLLGARVTAIPSVRVGMCWALEHLGCRRHMDDVLVPKFLGRCILNALNRVAMPVERLTENVRLVIVVHQFGVRQDLDAIRERCREASLRYVEDSPYGMEAEEHLGPEALAKFIGLSKILPVLKGAVMLTDDRLFEQFVKRKRSASGAASWIVLMLLSALRRHRYARSYAASADVAYELFLESAGDNRLLRGNQWRGWEQLTAYQRCHRERLDLIRRSLGDAAVIPDTTRLAYVVPLAADSWEPEAAQAFTWHGFDSSLYHMDRNRNLFAPAHQRVFLIPLNPAIPQMTFERLVQALAGCKREATRHG